MLNSCVVNPKVARSAEFTYIAAIVLMCFGCHDIRHQTSKVGTHPSVASFAAFFPAARNSHTQATTECAET